MSGGGVLGGGVIFVVAAVLWAAVLVPTWMRRREFRVSEQNAMRLQRTLRVLAESAEIPEEVRLEANAREAVAHAKLLRSAERRQESERAAELSEARAAERRAELLAADARRREATVERAARLRTPLARRLRSVSTLIALLALVGTLLGAGMAIAGMGAVVLGSSVLVFAAAFGGLVLLAPGRVRDEAMRRLPEVAPVVVQAAEVSAPEVEAASGRTAEEHASVQAAAAERIARARAHARARAAALASAQREAHPDSMLLREKSDAADAGATVAGRAAAAPAAPATAAAAPAAPGTAAPAAAPAAAAAPTATRPPRAPRLAPSAQRSQELAAALRLQRMGVVDDTSGGMPDLDAAMRRRRDVG